jgi:hypothetical protein
VLLLVLAVAGAGVTAGVGSRLEVWLRGNPISHLFDPGSRAHAGLVQWLRGEASWMAPTWIATWFAGGLIIGLAFPHWRLRYTLGAMVGFTAALMFLPTPFLAASEWAQRQDTLWEAVKQALPQWRTARFVVLPLIGGLGIAAAGIPLGARTGRTLHTRRGLRSWRLKKARKRRQR